MFRILIFIPKNLPVVTIKLTEAGNGGGTVKSFAREAVGEKAAYPGCFLCHGLTALSDPLHNILISFMLFPFS